MAVPAFQLSNASPFVLGDINAIHHPSTDSLNYLFMAKIPFIIDKNLFFITQVIEKSEDFYSSL